MNTNKTPKEQDLFDWDTHAQPAIDQAEGNANPDWKTIAEAAILLCAECCDTFTSDEVITTLRTSTVETHNLMALGGLFQKAARQGMIENTGQTRQTTLKERHRKLTVWRSLIRSID